MLSKVYQCNKLFDKGDNEIYKVSKIEVESIEENEVNDCQEENKEDIEYN